MIQANEIAYVALDRRSYSSLRPAHRFNLAEKRVALLWGDPGYVISVQGGRAIVPAKGHRVEPLSEDLLLWLDQADCEQGDSAIIQFSGDRRLMVDAGPLPNRSNSGKIVTSGPEYLADCLDRI